MEVLIHLLIVVVAARVAAEIAERLRQPAVLMEILAGVLIGPSVLRLIRADDVLTTLAELGAILLLFEVGMHTNLAELRRVGSDSIRVAGIGVVMPFALGLAVMLMTSTPLPVALFIAGAITATSVGVTARVFGDLRSLATPEARIVLGAAVVDDVAGLLILTVVTGVASAQVVALGDLGITIGLAIGFVVLAAAAGIAFVPAALEWLSRRARTDGTLTALGLGLALIFAAAASIAGLAPIIGAFIAGLAVSQSRVRDDLHRRLQPVGHFVIPIFFLMIGVETDLKSLIDPTVVLTGLVISLAAIAGKLLSGTGVKRGNADRWTVGIAMIPRGEVGLIFAGVGLAAAILDDRSYAALVLVVIVTTLLPPAWIRQRILAKRREAVMISSSVLAPDGGWLRIDEGSVTLAATPPAELAPLVWFEAAVACTSRRPDDALTTWMTNTSDHEVVWDERLRNGLFELLLHGNERSWRLLDITGTLSAAAPSLQEAISSRALSSFDLDGSNFPALAFLDELRAAVSGDDKRAAAVWQRFPHKQVILLATLGCDVFDVDQVDRTTHFARTIGFDPADLDLLSSIVADRSLLPAAAARFDLGTEETVLGLAAHIGATEIADALYLMGVAADAMEPWEREALDELFDLVQAAIAIHRIGDGAADLVEHKRAAVSEALIGASARSVRKHLDEAPRRYILAQPPDAIALHLKMMHKPFASDEVRVETEWIGDDNWIVHVAALDRHALLARLTGVFAVNGIQILDAVISTWTSGIAVDVFKVHASEHTDWGHISSAMSASLSAALPRSESSVEGTISIDNVASPWNSIVEIRAQDRIGLLHRMAVALSNARIEIHSASLHTKGDVAVDTFFVTGPSGGKLDQRDEERLTRALSGKTSARWRRRGLVGGAGRRRG